MTRKRANRVYFSKIIQHDIQNCEITISTYQKQNVEETNHFWKIIRSAASWVFCHFQSVKWGLQGKITLQRPLQSKLLISLAFLSGLNLEVKNISFLLLQNPKDLFCLYKQPNEICWTQIEQTSYGLYIFFFFCYCCLLRYLIFFCNIIKNLLRKKRGLTFFLPIFFLI